MFVKCVYLMFSVLLLSAQAKRNKTHRQFPANFLFGTSTSAYQVEGGWNAHDKGESIWDRFTHTTSNIKDGSTGDIACNSYNKIKIDLEMLKALGVNYYRFSLSWSRIFPTGFENEFSTYGVVYYNNLINLLLENNISPVVTLHHFDLPQKLQDIGGWENPLIEKYFVHYADTAFKIFGDRVKEWLTFNEPVEICKSGYGGKTKAPGINIPGISDYLCVHNLLKAHATVYHLYDDKYRRAQEGIIGLTLGADWYEPDDIHKASDVEAADRALQFLLGWFAHPIFSKVGDYPVVMKERIANLSKSQGFNSSRLPSFTSKEVFLIRGSSDFFGLNHYTTYISRNLEQSKINRRASFSEDMGIVLYQRPEWPSSATSWLKVVPWGFRKLLLWIKNEYSNPFIIVYENGYSDKGGTKDDDRINYFNLYLNALLDAVEQGVSVIAYTAWCLMDSFEWSSGYTEKFGLYEVDFNSSDRTRIPKSSVGFLSGVFKTKVLPRPNNL